MYGYIYKITNKINQKIYIGKHKSTFFDQSYWGSGKLINRAYKKYGKENFTREFLEECQDLETLNKQEKYYINLYESKYPNGYNISNGGDGGDIFHSLSTSHQEKVRESISNYMKDRCLVNHQTKNKVVYNNGDRYIYLSPNDPIPDGFVKGKGNLWKNIPWNKGLTKETDSRVFNGAKKMAESKKGSKPWNKGLTKENSLSLQKTSNTLLGHKVSSSTRKKISDKSKNRVMITDGVQNKRIPQDNQALIDKYLSEGWRYGKAKTGLDRKLYNSVVIKCIETGKVYNSLSSAGRDLKGIISIPTIRKILNTNKKYKNLSFITV